LFRNEQKKVKKIKQFKRVVNTRSTTILPVMNGCIILVHNGRMYRPVEIKPYMFGTKLGEHVRTKSICVYRRRKNKKKKQNRIKQHKKQAKKKSK
jgi:ribosomal protein S19